MQVTSIKPMEIQKEAKKKEPEPSQWQMLINSLLRPPRMRYNECQMGCKNFSINQRPFTRSEETVLHREKKIGLSIFLPEFKNNKLILYLHGNSSSKLESKLLLPFLPQRFALASFDFLGCGNNMEEDFITLGYDEAKQVESVVNYLKAQGYQVYIWGRSMGAASALLFGKSDIIVADSPFRSMKKLCKELSTSKVNPLPNFLVNCLFPCVFMKLRSDIKQKGKYDIEQLNIEKAVSQMNPSHTLIFITGSEDELVNHHNSEKLFELFKGSKKYLEVVPGNHNSKRPDDIVRKIMAIIESSSDTLETMTEPMSKDEIKIKMKESL